MTRKIINSDENITRGMDSKTAIFEIARALGANEVDIPSFQYQNTCSGGINGLVFDDDVENIYYYTCNNRTDCSRAFQYLFTHADRTNPFNFSGIPRIVWAVVDSNWEELLKEMESQDYLTPCENCTDLYYPEDMAKIDGLIYCENCKGNLVK